MYLAQGDTESAVEILNQAVEAVGETEDLIIALAALVPETPEPTPEPTPAPEQSEPSQPSANEPQPNPPSAEDLKVTASRFVGRPVSELYAAVGMPISSNYAPSRLVDGDEGELIYDGFIVYTTRAAEGETVYLVVG